MADRLDIVPEPKGDGTDDLQLIVRTPGPMLHVQYRSGGRIFTARLSDANMPADVRSHLECLVRTAIEAVRQTMGF